jgi:TonB family protein
MTRKAAWSILICILSGSVFAQLPANKFPDRVQVAEFVLRKYVVKSEMPAFPNSSFRRQNQGVSVSSVSVDDHGLVTNVSVWEAPDKEIAKSIERSLRHWKFKPPTIGGRPVPISGKLTFYFSIENGKPSVRNPKPFL